MGHALESAMFDAIREMYAIYEHYTANPIDGDNVYTQYDQAMIMIDRVKEILSTVES
jgi:hypothetical protein